MADVFLSYDREDVARAERLANALIECGWSVWWDRKMRVGPSFRRVITEELERAKCVVVLWSSKSIDSDWVCEEADEARQRGVLVPVLLDLVRPPLGFRQHQSASLVGWDGSERHPDLELLREGIKHHVAPHLDKKAPNAPAPPTQPTRLSEGEERSHQPIRVFVSYRREDKQDAAGRLLDRLVDRYGAERVSKSIKRFPFGLEIVEHLPGLIARCSAVVVVIGREWLSGTDSRGYRRLDKDNDHVRREIATALQLEVPTIPVLVQNARMPTADDLPEDMQLVAQRNGMELSSVHWDEDVERLIKELDRVMKPSTGP